MATSSHIIMVSEQAFASLLENAGNTPVLVDFFAEWCGPCKMLSPIMHEIAEEMQGKAIIAKCNVDDCPNIAGEFGISSIPAVMIFKNGAIVWEQVGLSPKDVYTDALNAHM